MKKKGERERIKEKEKKEDIESFSRRIQLRILRYEANSQFVSILYRATYLTEQRRDYLKTKFGDRRDSCERAKEARWPSMNDAFCHFIQPLYVNGHYPLIKVCK